MASIIKYIGQLYVSADQKNLLPPGMHTWDGYKGYAENLSLLPWEEQVRCSLDQMLAISYYLTFYGRGCHEVVNEYIDEVLADLNTRVIPCSLKQFPSGPYNKVIQTLVLLAKYCKSGRWESDVDIDLVKDILLNHPFQATPTAWGDITKDASCCTGYIPFIMFMNPHVHPDYKEYACRDMGVKVFSFRAGSTRLNNNKRDDVNLTLSCVPYPIGDSFSTKETPLDSMHACPLLAYISRFNTRGRDFNTIIGALGASCLTLDVNHPGATVSQRIAALVAANVMNIGSVTGSVGEFKPFGYDSDRSTQFKLLATLLEYLHKAYGTVASDGGPVTKLFSCFATTKQQKETVAYISEHGGSASADHLSDSNEGLCIGTEALTFISQRPSLLSAQSQVTEPKAEEKAEEKTTETSKEETKTETKEEEAEADSTKEDDTEQDLGEDDTSTTDEKSKDDKPEKSDDPDTSKEETPAPTQAEPSAPPEEKEPQVDTSDYIGFEFKTISAESETIDSVMFKEEMSSFLTNVLANPPDGLSPQNVAVLTALQRFWLHSLSIESIVGIVGSCLKHLPKSLIQLNTKLYGVKRQ